MDSFSSPSSSGSPASSEQLMEQIKAQLAQAFAQEFLEEGTDRIVVKTHPLVQFLIVGRLQLISLFVRGENRGTVGNKCFAKCVTKPGTSLSGSESSCISRCVDRYMEATGIVSRALFSPQR
uniref:Mitochondrial import inner membrane translocase subunit n=1 Tax=Leersia perrieri TaxID=77586 RepID=A0A0D9W8K1_9ORYZ